MWKNKIEKLKNDFKTNKLKFILRFFCYFLFVLQITSIQVLSTMHGLNLIPVAITALFTICIFLYGLLYGRLVLDIFGISLIIFIFYAFVLTLFTTKLFSPHFITFVKLFPLFWSLFVFVINFRSFKFLLFTIITSTIALAVVFSIVYFKDLFSINEISPDRLGDKFGHSNIVGSSFSTAIVISCVFYLVFRKYLAFLSVIDIYFLFLIFKTGSRLALVVSLLSIITSVFILFWKNNKKIIVIICFALVAFLVVFFTVPAFKVYSDRFLSIFDLFTTGDSEDGSTNIRFAMQLNGYQLWFKNLFFGYGSEGFMKNTSFGTYSHSTLCETLCNFGLIGFTLFFGPYLFVLFNTEKKDNLLNIMLKIISISIILPNLFAGMLIYEKNFYVILALIFGEYYLTKDKNMSFEIKREVIENKTKFRIFCYMFLGEKKRCLQLKIGK